MLSSISDTAPVFAVAVCHNGVCRCTELWAEGDYMNLVGCVPKAAEGSGGAFRIWPLNLIDLADRHSTNRSLQARHLFSGATL